MQKSMRAQTCCFTGHRELPSEEVEHITRQLENILRCLIGEGIRYMGSGGARGFDLLAAEVVLRLRNEYPHIRLIMVLPCRDQCRGWHFEDVKRYQRILSQADKIVYVQENYTPGCMQKRNRHLVGNSSVCVAYCTQNTGGTAYTVEYAHKAGVRIILI